MNWYDVDFSVVNPDTYPRSHKEYEQWMCRPDGDKIPYAPWTDPNAPAPCDKCGTTAAECDHSARFKWGWEENHREFEAAKMSAVDKEIGGLVFIQREADPFVFVDGDDVRDPETGEVHPGFVSILADLGPSYADISTSGAGVHVYYRGTLPVDMTEASWQLDDSPWRSNENLPAVELYSGKHVCLTTGDHVAGSHERVRPWNSEALYDLLAEAGEYDPSHAPLEALDDSEPADGAVGGADSPQEAGSDHRSPVQAVNALDAQRVAEKTIVKEWNDAASTSDGERAFLPTWGQPSDSGTANIVNRNWWVDTGDHGGSGGPIEMAAIDLGILCERHAAPGAVEGGDFWEAYGHLQDLGFDLPDAGSGGEKEHSDYYDAPLGEYTDGDPWSDPEAMLEACLQARARGDVNEDADPPTLALTAVARNLLGEEKEGKEVGETTREILLDIYHHELSVQMID